MLPNGKITYKQKHFAKRHHYLECKDYGNHRTHTLVNVNRPQLQRL